MGTLKQISFRAYRVFSTYQESWITLLWVMQCVNYWGCFCNIREFMHKHRRKKPVGFMREHPIMIGWGFWFVKHCFHVFVGTWRCPFGGLMVNGNCYCSVVATNMQTLPYVITSQLLQYCKQSCKYKTFDPNYTV